MGPEESRQAAEPPAVLAAADPVEEYVRRCVAEAPPLSDAQRDEVASVLRSAPEPEQARSA